MPAASLLSTAKRYAHWSEDRVAEKHDSILVIYEPAVKRFHAIFRQVA